MGSTPTTRATDDLLARIDQVTTGHEQQRSTELALGVDDEPEAVTDYDRAAARVDSVIRSTGTRLAVFRDEAFEPVSGIGHVRMVISRPVIPAGSLSIGDVVDIRITGDAWRHQMMNAEPLADRMLRWYLHEFEPVARRYVRNVHDAMMRFVNSPEFRALVRLARVESREPPVPAKAAHMRRYQRRRR